ncbi:MAG: tripartite tricarboxylate transporter substrate binding protein [Betaproteobacteria bacterium]|nr:MAG: tripartite tricarboxylate transporter substrate binding protein [Betaproteobacteria bacterium]
MPVCTVRLRIVTLSLAWSAVMAAACAPALVLAQGVYPNRQITIVVGFSAGGSTDIVARLLADEMRRTWGQPVVIDNRPGAGGNIGAAIVAKAKPDGYTLLMGSVGPLAINASLYARMPYDNLKDFTPICLVVHVPNMLVVNPITMPVHSFAEFMALVKANPGKYFFASTGTGTSSHLSGEMLKTVAGVETTHVPYKGAVALNDLLAGDQVHFMFATIPSVIEFVRAGRLRALAVTSTSRSAAAPEIPTIAESGFPDFEASSWFGLLGPADLPRDITMKLQTELRRILNIPEIRDKLIQQGADPVASTPEEFGAYMRAETVKWAKVVKTSGARAD